MIPEKDITKEIKLQSYSRYYFGKGQIIANKIDK